LPPGTILSISADSAGHVWVGTNGEVVDDRLYLKESQKHLPGKAKLARLALDHITFDDQLQSRTLQPEVVIDYLEALRRGEELPPVRVVRDENDNYYLVDGHHRGRLEDLSNRVQP
jgi:hypothetical protein